MSLRMLIPPSILKGIKMRELSDIDRSAAEGFLDRRQSDYIDPDERDIGTETSLMEDVGCCGCIVVCVLILSPPTVLVGVILLSTGAILGQAPVFGSGLAVIVLGVVMGAGSAFVFVRLRSKPAPISPSRGGSVRRRHSQNTQGSFCNQRHGSRGIEPMEAQTIELTFCTSELTASVTPERENTADGQIPNSDSRRNSNNIANSTLCPVTKENNDATRTPILSHISVVS